MSHNTAVIFRGFEDTENSLSNNSVANDFKVWTVEDYKTKKIKTKKGARVMTKEKRVLSSYRRTIVGLVLFALVSLFSVITGKLMDRLGASLLLFFSLIAIIAFHNDKERWRKHSET